ncbi:hypothetical protein [Halalkalibacter sp. APA_J-10(15)]|uniref:hypothetical protein n=1 Tax=Halalkalibacter sp. APA_J-10(15) TaxID=2933805 RepID=UPI001FF4958C|nr:hypothetical protein [Halalkalibacter sp. APA_J-10(15)]MCK0473386.1 hypothetical protein [Halalkalibacter sp. APA_J-10(15)]
MGKFVVLFGAIIMLISVIIGLFWDIGYSEGSYLYLFHLTFSLVYLIYAIYCIVKDKKANKNSGGDFE